MKYCPYPFKTVRFKTREVPVGSVLIGAEHPIRIQSMTTTPTQDTLKTAEQIMRLADAGCEIVRVTVQGMKEAYSCEKIKSILLSKGYTTPLVADIHFFPKAALTVADFVDKVRINPGNYADKRAQFKILEYTDQQYAKELERLEEKFTPLVEKCRERGIALRIGTNHGSLSDRVLNRYGDSPKGMVQSALEYAAVCQKLDYHHLVFSMKASNTHVMIEAYRLLAAEMIQRGWDYPLHLGVTEAGSGEEGRIKSAVGIGSLLLDGLGDTIRVSLTEDPWHEIKPCRELLKLSEHYQSLPPSLPFVEKFRTPFEYQKRKVDLAQKPLHKEGAVYLKLTEEDLKDELIYFNLGFEEESLKKTLSSVDGVVLSENIEDFNALKVLKRLRELGVGIFSSLDPELSSHRFFIQEEGSPFESMGRLNETDLIFLKLKGDKLHYARRFMEYLRAHDCRVPVILDTEFESQNPCISLGAELGALLCDGLGEGVLLHSPHPLQKRRELSLALLQACRLRSSKTEFISCPSCGRTLFDLQTVTQKIQMRTQHLPGVKIAVMGCIVNGPGEMADADFGYVGSKPGKIDLYVGKSCVEKDIDYDQAVERLVDLLKAHQVWVEPKELTLASTTH